MRVFVTGATGFVGSAIVQELINNGHPWFTHFAMMDISASSYLTQKQLGWHPTQLGLMEDLDSKHYFEI